MNVRIVARVLTTLLVAALVVGIGVGIYNAGVSAGLSEAARATASGDAITFGYPDGAPYLDGPMGWGFGAFFGVLFWIFVLFLVFGLIRAAVGGGNRDRHHRAWGERRDRAGRAAPRAPSQRGSGERTASGGRVTTATMPGPCPGS